MDKYINMLYNSKSPAESTKILLTAEKDKSLSELEFKKVLYAFEYESK